MTVRSCILTVALLLLPASAFAGPITTGVWSSTAGTTSTSTSGTSGDSSITPFWTGQSWDCALCGVGWILGAYDNAQLEYLNDGAGNAVNFLFTDEMTTPTLIYNNTWATGGILGLTEDGAFTYFNGVKRTYNSADGGQQFALFRLVGAESTQYFLAIEDIIFGSPLNDHDYNDYVVSFTSPQPVPEPGTLMLLGSGVAAMVVRWRNRRRVSGGGEDFAAGVTG